MGSLWVPFVLNAIPVVIVAVGVGCAFVMYAIDLTKR